MSAFAGRKRPQTRVSSSDLERSGESFVARNSGPRSQTMICCRSYETATTWDERSPPDEETALLAACLSSRSRGLYTAVIIAFNTGMRETEIRTLRWQQIDFSSRRLRVGRRRRQPVRAGMIPMNDRLTLGLRTWANRFPDARNRITFRFPCRTIRPTWGQKNQAPTMPIRRSRSAVGKPLGPMRRRSQFYVGFTISGIVQLRVFWRAACLPIVASLLAMESEHHDEDGKALRTYRKRSPSCSRRGTRSERQMVAPGHKKEHSDRQNPESRNL